MNVAFEGNASHLFLKGAGNKDITLTVGRQDVQRSRTGMRGGHLLRAVSGLYCRKERLARE